MKNGTRPLYSAPPLPTNGSAKKRAFSLRKKILLLGLIAVVSGIGIWQGEHQKPVTAPHGMITVFTATTPPEPLKPPPGRATAFGLTPDEYKREYPEVRRAEPVETLSDINRRLGRNQ
jgi:hypothetical protein